MPTLASARLITLRFLAWLALTVWVGGFMFYSAGVLPVLHEDMDSIQAGYITQRVTDLLNASGVAALAVWWVVAFAERRSGPTFTRRARLAALAASTVLLVFLLVQHRAMDLFLETGRLRGFYPMHRAYLVASTAQWLANLALIGTSLVLWRDGGGRREGPPAGAGSDGSRGD